MTGGNAKRRRKGEPVLALGVLAVVWIAVRAAGWQSPFPSAAETVRPAGFVAQPRRAAPEQGLLPAVAPAPSARRAEALWFSPPTMPAPHAAGAGKTTRSAATVFAFAAAPTADAPAGSAPARQPPLAGPAFAPWPEVTRPPAERSVRVDRPKSWRVDTWFTWRSGVSALEARSLVPTYGASQAGVLARTDLAQGPRRPQAYLRLLHAPGGPRQSEAAIGLSARAIGRLPVRLQVEARATRSAGSTTVRPAILAVSELPPLALPLDLTVEGYGQAGWVGGRFATPFADGQLRLEREVLATGGARLRLGAGGWGGAQRGASRLDIGPTATLDLRDGPLPGRVSVDYRQRIAGRASPGSGVAVTLSTGF
ncbi:MAG: hypothetical protein ACEQR8_07585 [Cypionkella sp.]